MCSDGNQQFAHVTIANCANRTPTINACVPRDCPELNTTWVLPRTQCAITNDVPSPPGGYVVLYELLVPGFVTNACGAAPAFPTLCVGPAGVGDLWLRLGFHGLVGSSTVNIYFHAWSMVPGAGLAGRMIRTQNNFSDAYFLSDVGGGNNCYRITTKPANCRGWTQSVPINSTAFYSGLFSTGCLQPCDACTMTFNFPL